jgi:hypothetical protein
MTYMDETKSKAGAVAFQSSDSDLNEGFIWAKQQAMAYAHFGEDAVGLWYEASLPNRQAFCMRDVAHHSIGASVLGLSLHTKNMFMKFAENIAKSRDWCTYWEITKDNEPAPVDYENDQDFWYNLPANFDVIDASFRQYLWTGDLDYVDNPAILAFYQLTVKDYVDAWDKDGDGILEHYPHYGRRGLATYNEAGLQPIMGGDMIAAQIAGYRAYARLIELKGKLDESKVYEQKAEDLERLYETDWWNEANGRFFGAMLQDKSFLKEYNAEGNFLPLYFGAVKDHTKLYKTLEDLNFNGVANVEGKTYLPDIFYRYDMNQQGYRELKDLVNPSLDRRDYPEVSYCVIGSVAAGLMGIAADGHSTVTTLSRLSDELEWATISSVPILNRTLTVTHKGNAETAVTHQEGSPFLWKAILHTDSGLLKHNGKVVKAETEKSDAGKERAFLVIEVAEGETHRVSLC